MKNVLKIVMVMFALLSSGDALAKDASKNIMAVGDKALDFTLPNAKGDLVTLYDALKKGPVVVSFYRGGWCPFCNTQLAGYQARLADIKAAGGELIAISPEVPSKTELTMVKNKLTFEVLSDANNKVAESYGLVMTIDDEHVVGFSKWLKESTGETLADFNGVNGYRLPLPATFVIGTNGVVLYRFKDADYKKRANLDDIIAKLNSVN